MHAHHDGAFYDQQAEDWNAVATGDCATDEAWFHYYKTANYSNRFGSGEYDLAAILAAGEKVMDPNDFYLPYLRYATNKHPTERWPDLLVAHANGPNHHEAYTSLVAYHESRNETEERNVFVARLHRQNPLPAGVMEYNYNQLMSVGNNGILLTNGDADTYPSWILQTVYGVRQDVRVASVPLLRGYPEMRKGFLAELGLNDLSSADGAPPSVPELLELLAGQSKPIYLAATGRDYLDELPKEKLYLSGLAFYYGNFPIDNLEILASNFERKFRMENLRQPLTDGPAQAVADQLNQNYLPALLELHAYNKANPSSRFQPMLSLIEPLAERVGRSAEVDAYLRGDNPPQLASNDPGLRAKGIYKATVYIPKGTLIRTDGKPGDQKIIEQIEVSGFFLGGNEVSNADYQIFLEDLLRQRKFRMLDSAAVAALDMSVLKEDFPNGYGLEAFAGHLTGSHPDFAEYPVVNVSRRAVELYAIWLSQVYNQDPKRIDGRNVRFRLPNANEFEYASRGGKKNAPYPWGGPYFRNLKGCLLANFNTLHPEAQQEFERYIGKVKTWDQTDKRGKEILEKVNCDYEDDGGFLTVKVGSYFPNDYGLYNMAGNAAEMLAEEGKTMGGSWLDPGYKMQNGVVTERQLPHLSTGFRLVMEYID